MFILFTCNFHALFLTNCCIILLTMLTYTCGKEYKINLKLERGNKKMIKLQNFGVEVEFNRITRQAVAHKIAQEMGWTTPIYTRSYDTWTTMDNEGRKWKVVKDMSIVGPDDRKCELVTPILQYKDIETLQKVIRIIRKAGGKVDPSCGIHIHVDKMNHSAKSLKNLVNIMYSKEDLIYNALEVSDARAGRWCKKVRPDLVESLKNCKNIDMDKLGDMWYKGFRRSGHYNDSRYHGLNFHNVWYAHTVEFRLFNSSLHAGKIKAYIQFCLAISAQAIEQKSARATKTVTTNEKYTFRTWLLRLGMNGEEFKTARLHLLKNLEGDAAFKNGRPA